MQESIYPDAVDPERVGSYPAFSKSGGGYVWDEVLEYRVWCHPERGAPDEQDGNDYFYAFDTYDSAEVFAATTAGTEEPLALLLQREYIAEPEPGVYVHMREERITEWQVRWLKDGRRTPGLLEAFFAPDAPPDRLDILRGNRLPAM